MSGDDGNSSNGVICLECQTAATDENDVKALRRFLVITPVGSSMSKGKVEFA